MFQKIKFSDIIILSVLLLTTLTSIYFYVNSLARSQFWLKTYPVRAELSARQITCSENSPKWLTDILTYQTKYNNAPANQIAYIESNGTLHHCENGYVGQYPVLSDAISEQTRFRYASVTKLWTADAILQLVKDVKLSLDTKLSGIITEIDAPKDIRINDITIGQLLLHRAGFDRYSFSGNDMFGIGKNICPNNLNGLNDIQLGFDPDSKTSYSNLGYCLLGEVISRLNDNQPYTDIIARQYNFADTHLKFISDSALDDEVTYNYVETGLTGFSDIYTAFDYDALASSAGLSGNAIELAQQVRAMAANPEPNILSNADKVGCDTTQIAECYGYAIVPYQPLPNLPMVHYRDGSLLGLSTVIAVDERGATVALLSNGTSNEGMEGSNKVKLMIYEYLAATL